MTSISREAILAALRERAPRAMHLAEICKSVGVAPTEREPVLDVLDQLSSVGVVQQMPGHRFRLRRKKRRAPDPEVAAPPRASASSPPGRVQGRLSMSRRGFGFVVVGDGGSDVFVPPDRLGGAMHGDQVTARTWPSPKGREGEILEVLGRGLRRVVGTLHRAGRREAFVEPDDERLRGPLPVEGRVPREAKDGLAVVCEIVRYPQGPRDTAEVRITDVLGVHGMTAVEVAKIKLREGVVEIFPEDVVDEAVALGKRVTAAERRGREDLRDLPLVTIDPPDARDHDDALWATRTEDGGFRLIVAIADVSHYVRDGSALDREAAARGFSIYLPDRAIPMLPPELSSDLASLVPDRDRLCMAADVTLGPNGAVREYRLVEGVLRSRARLTYEGVAHALGLSKAAPAQPETAAHMETIEVLQDLARKLRKRRLRRGALGFDLPEARVKLDPHGVDPVDVYRARSDAGIREAYGIVEEMMLLANEIVGTELTKRRIPTVYRVHGKPDGDKLALFAELATSLGFELDVDEAQNPKRLGRFLRRIEGTEHASVLGYLALRSMQQARYDTKNVGHFALALEDYVHFTSPIRRYPDLIMHRVIRAIVRGQHLDFATLRPALKRAGAESSWLERRAMTVERQVVDLYRAILLRDRVGDVFDATVSGIAEHGVFCSLDSPFADVLIPLERLDDAFERDRLGIRLTGIHTGIGYALGDRLEVRLEQVDVGRRQLVALPTTHLPGGRALDEPRPAEARPEPRRRRQGRDRGREGNRRGRRRR